MEWMRSVEGGIFEARFGGFGGRDTGIQGDERGIAARIRPLGPVG